MKRKSTPHNKEDHPSFIGALITLVLLSSGLFTIGWLAEQQDRRWSVPYQGPAITRAIAHADNDTVQ